MDVRLPCGIFNTNYKKDIAIIRTKTHWAWLIGGFLLSIILPLFLGMALLNWVIETCIMIIAVIGLYFVTGLCGQISLGQAGFMAVGAYSTAILMNLTGISYWLVLPISALLSGVISLLFGLPALRVKGFYLALATLAAQHIIIWAITHPPLSKWSGGFDGVTVPIPQLGPIAFDTTKSWFVVIILFLWLMIYFAKNIARTKMGRAFVAIRDSDLAAEMLGINIFRYKLAAFFLAGIFAGVAGSLFGPYIISIAPENFEMDKSIWFLGMLIVGGSGSLVGAIAGTIIIRFVLELTIIFSPYFFNIPTVGPILANYAGGIIFGLVVVLFLIFEPHGINHRWETFKASYRLHPFSY